MGNVKLSLITSIIFFLFLGSYVSAGTSCSPDSGFDFCWKNDAWSPAYCEVQVTEIKDATGSYASKMVEEAYVDVKHTGKKLYAFRGLKSWSDVSCDWENGCNGDPIEDGKYIIGELGDKNPSYVAFVVWDITTESWCWTGYGWTGADPYYAFEVVECRNNDQCRPGTFCSSETYECVAQICYPGEARCKDDGTVEYCADAGDRWWKSYCKSDEVCEDGECVFLDCAAQSKWICDGDTKNYHKSFPSDHKCESKITEAFDCNELDEPTEDDKFCVMNNIVQKTKDYYCLTGDCEYIVKDVTVQECKACFEGECVTCNFDMDCGRLEICQDHECATVECKTTPDCPSRTIENGKVAAECQEYSCIYTTTCDFGYSFYEDKCVFNWSPYIFIGIIIAVIVVIVGFLKMKRKL